MFSYNWFLSPISFSTSFCLHCSWFYTNDLFFIFHYLSSFFNFPQYIFCRISNVNFNLIKNFSSHFLFNFSFFGYFRFNLLYSTFFSFLYIILIYIRWFTTWSPLNYTKNWYEKNRQNWTEFVPCFHHQKNT